MQRIIPTSRMLESKREQARFLNASSYKDLLVNTIAFLTIAAVFFPLRQHVVLFAWILLNAVALFSRYAIVYKLRKSPVWTQGNIGLYINLFWAGILISGLVFGSAGFFLFPHNSLFHQVFLAIILWGTSATSIGYYAPSLGVSVAYSLLSTLPVTLSFLFHANGVELHTIIAILGVVYLVLQCVFSIKMNKYFTDNLNLQLDNVALTREFAHEVKARMASEKRAKDCPSY